MLDIWSVLEKRTEYGFNNHKDYWLEECLTAPSEKELWVIIPSSVLYYTNSKEDIVKLKNHYYIAGMYSIGSPYINMRRTMVLVHFVKDKPEYVDFSFYKVDLYFNSKCPKDGLFYLPDSFPDIYIQYINLIETWINNNILPEDILNKYEFTQVPFSKIDVNNMYPNFYSKNAQEIRNLISEKDTFPLRQKADIICSHSIKDKGMECKVLKIGDLSYPLKLEDIAYSTAPVNTIIQKNDILISKGVGDRINLYIVLDEIIEKIYAGNSWIIIRPTDIYPSYLFLYLRSNVSKIIINSLIPGGIPHISENTLKELPIIEPTETEEIYKNNLLFLLNVENSNYLQYKLDSTEECNNIIEQFNNNINISKVSQLVNESILSEVQTCARNQINLLFQEDINAINDCFRYKHYKAVLILAGSLLEAFLIDWFSELSERDYFSVQYTITGRNGRTRNAILNDYIKAIKDIIGSDWESYATKADNIREKRNMVHPKVRVDATNVNEATCREIIDDLIDIINSRQQFNH